MRKTHQRIVRGGRDAGILLLSVLLCLAATAIAQTTPGDPGQNRNLIGLTPDPADIRTPRAANKTSHLVPSGLAMPPASFAVSTTTGR